MKYTIIATPGPERYEVAKFFWLEDAVEYLLMHGASELFYDGQALANPSLDDRMALIADPAQKVDYLLQLKGNCQYMDEREWKRTHPQPWEGPNLQPPPMRSFGDPNWYRQGGTIAPKEYHQYVTVGDSGMKREDSTGGPSSIAST